MVSSLLAQSTINGIIAGSIYALVASGFSLIYSTNKFMHFAHGSSVVVSGYIIHTLFSLIGIPFYLSVILTILYRFPSILILGIEVINSSPALK